MALEKSDKSNTYFTSVKLNKVEEDVSYFPLNSHAVDLSKLHLKADIFSEACNTWLSHQSVI